MCLQRLDIYNVRNICAQSISPSPTLNFIYGKNGSGKSALIEAIFLLGRTKSFRTSSIKSVIRFGQDKLTLSARLQQKNQHNLKIGVQLNSKDIEIRINQQTNCKRSELAHAFPIQLIHPKSFELLDAGAQIRREFMDWGIFNEHPDYLMVWRKYKKSLAHRNVLLKTKTIKELNVWNKELDIYGTMVNQYRYEYLAKLKPLLLKTIQQFLPLDEFELKLLPGWDDAKQLEKQLGEDLEKDLRYGYTQSGPHRGDFHLLLNHVLARDVVSRGQLKLLVICLKLAQVQHTIDAKEIFGCFLVDDFSAELDRLNRAKVLRYLNEMKCQVFITATELDDFGNLNNIEDYKVFHVEQGNVVWVNVPHGTSEYHEEKI